MFQIFKSFLHIQSVKEYYLRVTPGTGIGKKENKRVDANLIRTYFNFKVHFMFCGNNLFIGLPRTSHCTHITITSFINLLTLTVNRVLILRTGGRGWKFRFHA